MKSRIAAGGATCDSRSRAYVNGSLRNADSTARSSWFGAAIGAAAAWHDCRSSGEQASLQRSSTPACTGQGESPGSARRLHPRSSRRRNCRWHETRHEFGWQGRGSVNFATSGLKPRRSVSPCNSPSSISKRRRRAASRLARSRHRVAVSSTRVTPECVADTPTVCGSRTKRNAGLE